VLGGQIVNRESDCRVGHQSVTLIMRRAVKDLQALRMQLIRIQAPELKTFFAIQFNKNTTICEIKGLILVKLFHKGFRRRFLNELQLQNRSATTTTTSKPSQSISGNYDPSQTLSAKPGRKSVVVRTSESVKYGSPPSPRDAPLLVPSPADKKIEIDELHLSLKTQEDPLDDNQKAFDCLKK